MDVSSQLCRIALACASLVNPILGRQLVSYFGSVENLFAQSRAALLTIPGFSVSLANQLTSPSLFDAARLELDYLNKYHIQFFFFADADYPPLLAQCPDAPLVLFYKGSVPLFGRPMLAFVGTRRASAYGRACASQAIRFLAARHPHLVVVSGLASGIDVFCQKEARKCGLDSLAVLPTPINKIYPAENRDFATDLLNHGGVISEHVTSSVLQHSDFFSRNRIVVGLCSAVVVVQSPIKGGSLISADFAGQYNRDCFAFPGAVGDASSAGCNWLIQQNKASLITSGADLEFLAGLSSDPLTE